jgi:phosphoglycolate phosphatase-like HAD superfamily hydrolase
MMKLPPHIVVDLDGTILDNKKRLFNSFKIASKSNEATFEEYIGFRRDGLKNYQILEQLDLSKNVLESFQSDWLALIESEKMLELDTLFHGVVEWLQNLTSQGQISLCTARKTPESCITQLNNLGISRYFTNLGIVGDAKGKIEWIRNLEKNSTIWYIGDTPTDLEISRAAGVNSILVSTGLWESSKLVALGPDIFVPKITDLNSSHFI